MHKRLIALLPLLIALGCENNEDAYAINGTVEMKGTPLSGVLVSVDNKFNWSTETGADGAFSLPNIPKGEHQLFLSKTFEAGEFGTETALTSLQTLDLAVNENISLGVIDIAPPQVLFPPSNVTHSSVELKWSETTESDFRMYTVYRHTASDVSNTVGTKIFTSVAKADTVFQDNDLEAKATYYYRVYTLLGPGEQLISNVLTVTTPNVSALSNSSFEVLNDDGTPADWQLYKNITTELIVDQTVASEGSNSLKFEHTLTDGCYEIFAVQRIERALLEPGARYLLKFKYKSNFTYSGDVTVIKTFASEWLADYFQIPFTNSEEWKTFEEEIVIPSNLENYDLNFNIDFCMPINGTWYVDEVTLTKV